MTDKTLFWGFCTNEYDCIYINNFLDFILPYIKLIIELFEIKKSEYELHLLKLMQNLELTTKSNKEYS